ncbi:dephospho-CoA kinase [Leucobacter sp. Psy1]|uniref:dephospho-CoA kinase n=1 Tax=Leucobacter sp. Psy1 TaxID=2875729 RepID=UPI001CD6D18A|nr:dephospho-CoA kinase [Leucobacter sp. Psy1]UBH06210.1 dephospho-CoA kinase [Leucobacter sp. Psy1]
MPLIGLTGGIAAGKSTIGRRLEALGATRIDADQLARDAVEPESPGLAGIREAFGAEVIAADGTLDRPALGQRVFGDPEQLERLNAIVHPEVRRLARVRVDAVTANDPDAVVVYEIPLLVESDATLPWDLVVVAEAADDVRRERLVSIRGMTPEEADRRLASQASNAERRAVADVVIDTGGTEAETLAATDALWSDIRAGLVTRRGTTGG